ncbi:MAG: hypothetical protein KGJ62_03365 [Armatimonadetes bacterium]|nr:hypothetical protein [Armatimonadota bacterium]MDE2205727.1 hypothetical protein [Armatimonadota bacterium]
MADEHKTPADGNVYYAHSAGADGAWQTMREHTANVMEAARNFAEAFASQGSLGKRTQARAARCRGIQAVVKERPPRTAMEEEAAMLWIQHARL